MNSPDWAAATFDGLRLEQRRAIATLTASDRFEWLNEAVALAMATGALGRAFAEKQRLIDVAWTVPHHPPVVASGADTPRATEAAATAGTQRRADARPHADATLDRARLQAYRYVTVDETASYLAVVDVFTDGVAGLLSDLSAAEVQAALGERGFELDLDTVEARLTYLVDHGNLIRSPREAEARTIREYLTARARFQIAPLGEIVHPPGPRTAGYGGAGTRGLYGSSPRTPPGPPCPRRAVGRASAGAITALFAAHQQLVQSTRAFYVGLGEALARVDLDAETLAAYREMLIDYLQRFVEDVRRYQPLIVEALDALDVDDLLAATNPGPRLLDAKGQAARRAPGLQREDWAGLDLWFRGSPTRSSDADEVRTLATRAMGALLVGLRRTVGGAGERSRRGDLLRLASAFARSDDVSAHRLWIRAFGLYPARHLAALPAVEDVAPTTSWWDAPPGRCAAVPSGVRRPGRPGPIRTSRRLRTHSAEAPGRT